MAYSYGYFKTDVKKFLESTMPETSTVLDIGAGCGTYYNLLHEYFNDMDAVEAFPANIERYNLRNKYKQVFNEDIRNFEFEYYDLIIMGDVLEHLNIKDAQKVIDYLYPRCKQLLVAVPYSLPQNAIEENEYEIHLQEDLTPELMNRRYPKLKLLCNNSAYGYYVKDTEGADRKLTNPKLSIIVPCHNVEKYIPRLLESLNRQSWGFQSDREVLFILDNCIDNTEKVINKVMKNSRYEWKTIKTSQGCPGGARNIGLENMTGDYLWFIDADDWLACDDAIDVVFGCMITDKRDILEFKIKSNANPKGVFGVGTVWMSMYSKEAIGDSRFNDKQNGEDNDFMGEIYRKPNLSFGRLDFAPYFYNFPRQDSLSDKAYGSWENLKLVIALGATRNLYKYLYPLIASICKYNFVKKIYLIIEDDKLNLPFGNIEYINFNKIGMDKKGENYNTGYTPMSMARNYLPNLIKEDKVLWLDCDIVVRSSLEELWDTNIEDYYCAGVKDIRIKDFHTPDIPLNYDNYINSGVTLFNLDKIRRDKKMKEMVYELNYTHFYFPDQDAINLIYKDKILFLDNKWNTSSFTGTNDNPIIYHYAGEKKDWVYQMDNVKWWIEAEELTDKNFQLEIN